jgi:hypothetical protein
VPGRIPPFPDELHECASCGIAYASLSVDAAIATVSATPQRVAEAVIDVSPADLRRRPDADTWSVLEYVCHLRDVGASYTIRLHRTRVEDGPALEPMLNDLRAVRFRYNRRDIVAVVAELADNAAGLVDEAERFGDDDWRRTATRLPGEERTALWLLRQAAHEGVHHLHDIAALLAGPGDGPDGGAGRTRRSPPLG